MTMNLTTRTCATVLLAGTTLLSGAAALAQGASTARTGNPFYGSGNSYIELGAGRNDFSLSDGTGLFPRERRDTSYKLAIGSYFDSNFGFEVGYTDFGSISRGGGQTQANALNLSGIGRIPLADKFNLLGRFGASYGRTSVTSLPGSGIIGGDENAWGLHVGVGAEYVFTPQVSVVLQYSRHGMKFAGGKRENIDNTLLGLRYRF